MSEPRVSIIMAVYNARRTVGHALDSLLAQTHRNLEIICVDDGSTDDSLAILRVYADRDTRIKVIAAAHAGATTTLNAGLDAATGDYLGFLDNDDAHHPRAVEMALKAFGDGMHDIVVWDWRDVADGDFERTAFPSASGETGVVNLTDKVGWGMGDHHVSFWCKLYRREVLEKIRFEPSVIHGDVVFYWRLWVDPAIRVAYLPIVLTYYREREGSVMHSAMTAEKAIDRARVIRFVAEGTECQPETLRRLKRDFFPERIWSVYKITRRQPELKGSVLPVLKRLIADGVVNWRYIRFVRAVKLWLAFLGVQREEKGRVE